VPDKLPAKLKKPCAACEYELMKYKLTSRALDIAHWDMDVVDHEHLVDPGNRFTWSQEFREMLGFKDEDDFPNVLHSWSDLLHPEDKERTLRAFKAHLLDRSNSTPYDIQYRLMLKNGNYRYFRAFGATVRDSEGRPLRVAGALQDITERQQAEQAKSLFLAGMSHEIRTPLNVIIGMTEIAKGAVDIGEKNDALNSISNASLHLLGLINNVLDMSKIEAGRLELSPAAFNLGHMLQKAVSIINFKADEKHQHFSVNIDPKVPRFVVGDAQRISQVIINLLSNAVKFTPEYGKISFDISLNGENYGGMSEVRFEVADSGIGISPEQQKRLFDVFMQADSSISRKFGGTGLGLSISKSIVEMMDGKIWVESKLGKGARFIFTVKFPVGNSRPREHFNKDGSKIACNLSFAGKKLLLVEDIEINRIIVTKLLKNSGLNIEYAENGKQALDMIRANPDKYDCIFMDMQMPIMDGLEATRRIRALGHPRCGEIPIIAMTANVFREDIESCKDAGMNDHIGKPVDVNEMGAKLHKYLSS
jgi:PAS domain S-box-containing protein